MSWRIVTTVVFRRGFWVCDSSTISARISDSPEEIIVES